MTLKSTQPYYGLMDKSVNIAPRHNPKISIPLVIFGCLCNAAMATMVKLIAQEYSLPNQSLVFFRFIFSFILLSLLLLFIPKYRPLSVTLKMNIWPPYAIRMVFGLLSLYASFFTIQKIPLSLAVLFISTSPLFIPIVSWIWKGIPIHKNLWWGLIIGFSGVVFIVGPRFTTLNIGYITGLVSGFFAAASYVTLRIQSHSEKPIAINFYFFLGAALISFIFTAKNLIPTLSLFSFKLWIYLFLLGVFGALAQGLWSIAFKWAQARLVGGFLYSSVAFAFLIEWVLFSKIPTLWMIMGMLLIICGGVLMTVLDPQKQAGKLEN